MIRRAARPLLAAAFVTGGSDAFARPEPRAELAEPVVDPVAQALTLSARPVTLVRVNAAAQVAAGALLATGRLRRLAAATLAASLVPTTLAGHRYWEIDDPARRTQQRMQFMKNAGLLGGLLLAAADSGGAPSLGWRARRAARSAGERALSARPGH